MTCLPTDSIPTVARFEGLEPRLLLYHPDPSPADNVFFRLPLSSDTAVHYYFDRNGSAPGAVAWNGTSQSYDGHRGTDYSGGPRGRPVFAVAPGILINKDDGHPDFGGPPNGNYVRISHGNNRAGQSIQTVYLHFNAGSVTTKAIGSFIAAGEQVGGVGTSGNSTGLHLHLETQLNRVAFDPYAAINSSEVSWWVDQGSGSPSTQAQPSKLNVGDSAEVYELGASPLNVRATPAGTSIGSRPNGSTGLVLQGPVWAAFNNDWNNSLWVWYRIRWSDGLEGWSVHNWLRPAPDTTPPQVLASAFDNDRSPHRFTIDFSENVGASLSPASFEVRNLANGQSYSTSVSFDPQTFRATVALVGTLADGNYRLRVLPSGVTDAAGNPLPQEHQLDCFHFAGDADRDRDVDIADFARLAANFNQSGRTFSDGDFNYNQTVDIADFSILAARFNTSLPGASFSRQAVAPAARPLAPAQWPTLEALRIDDLFASEPV